MLYKIITCPEKVVYHSKNIRKEEKMLDRLLVLEESLSTSEARFHLCLGFYICTLEQWRWGGAEDMSGPFTSCNSSSP